LILVTNKLSGIKQVASFPPKTTSPPQISSSELMSSRATPLMDDTSSIMEEDLTCLEDDELAAYDGERANEHGEKIILLRKRIRQVNIHVIYIKK
jgi:hypothetical protein